MAQKKNSDRVVWREFGSQDAALERGQPDRPPAQHDLRIQCSRKGRGGKTVTIVTGFQHRPETLASLCKKLKARCGSGGTVKDDTIEIQGDHRQTLLDALKGLGYGAKLSGG